MSDSSATPGAAPGAAPPSSSAPGAASAQGDPKAYWRANITFVAVLLLIWFTVSCVCSIFLVETLNEFHLGGFPLGFWFAQQGSVIVFILLILVYAIGMGWIDRKYGVSEASFPSAAAADPADAEAGE